MGTGMLDRFWDKNPDGGSKDPVEYFYMQATTGNGMTPLKMLQHLKTL